MNLRLALIPVHRWTGLTLGVIVLISALTGAGMAFRGSLDPVVNRGQFHATACAAPLPLDRLIDAAKTAHPTSGVDYIRLRAGADAPAAIRFFNKDTLYVDRCTGAITASQNRYQGFFGALELVHRMVFIPNGGWIVGIGAFGLVFILGLMGIYLWWPRAPRRFAQGWVVDRRLKGTMFTLGLHKTIGVWAVLILMVSAATALPNAFDPLKEAIISWGAPGKEAKPASVPPGKHAPKLALQAAFDTVQSLSPHPREVLIHLAKKGKDPLEIFIIDAQAPHANARTYLYLDAYSGKVLSLSPYSASGWGSRLYYWMLSIHTGQVGGVIGQLLLFLGAASVPVLAYTGASSYLRRRFRKPTGRRVAKVAAAKAS